MLRICLSRVGKKNEPSYRLIVADKHKDPWGKAIEIVGSLNPRSNPRKINLKVDRIKYWLSVGAQTSATIHNLLVDEKIIDKKKVKSSHKKVTAKPEEKPAEKKKTE